MSTHKYLLNEFMNQFGEIKHAYSISALKQNKITRKFTDQVRHLDDGFMVNDAVLALLFKLIPRQFRIPAKERLNARTKDVCQNIFADQMDILCHCVKQGWNSIDDYPYEYYETIIAASECMVEAIETIEAIGFNMSNASFRQPNRLTEACEQVLDGKINGLTKSVCEFNSSLDPEYVINVLRMQKSLFCDALKRAWNQTFLLNRLNVGEHGNKTDESIASMLASKQRARATQRSKEARLLKSTRENADRDVETFLQDLKSTVTSPESKEDVAEENEDIGVDGAATIDHLSLQLCAVEDVEKILQNNKKLKPADHIALKHLRDHKGCVSLIPIPDAYQNILSRFRARFPHMHVLADEIEANLSLLSLGGEAIPLKLLSQVCILDGVPGVGKTVAVAFLAKEFGTAFRVIDCAGQSNGFDIIGQSGGWSSGKSGYVADMLIGQKSPNAIMILDEVDKMNSSDVSPVENALYSLLESESAKRFRDEFYDFEMDASQINWLATSNDYERIPAPLRDRAKRIIIPMPNAEQRKTIASYLYQDARAEKEVIWGKYFAPELPDDVAELVAAEKNISIRGMKQIICSCFSMLSMKYSQIDGGVSLAEQSLTIHAEIAEESMRVYLKDNGADLFGKNHEYQQTRAGFIHSVSKKEPPCDHV